jgi:hypothetical protein
MSMRVQYRAITRDKLVHASAVQDQQYWEKGCTCLMTTAVGVANLLMTEETLE